MSDGTRNLLLDAIEARPGLHKSELQRRVGRAWGTVGYHLDQLVDEGRVRALRHGQVLRLFPGHTPDALMRRLATLRRPHARAVLDTLQRRPGATVTDLSRATGATRRTVRQRLADLRAEGLVAPSDERVAS